MHQQRFRIAVSILLCFLVQIQGADKYTDENRPYEFGFEVEVEGTKQQHRHEEKDKDGIIKGEFGFITADDVYHVTVYATDKEGRFKILSMKNIHLKSSHTSTAGSSASRQGHSLPLPPSPSKNIAPPKSSMPVLAAALPAAYTGAVSPAPATFAPAHPPPAPTTVPDLTSRFGITQKVITPQAPTLKKIPKQSPIRACSSCSIPTTTTQAPLVSLNNNPLNQPFVNRQNYPNPAPGLLSNLQSNAGNPSTGTQEEQTNYPESGSKIFSNNPREHGENVQINPSQPNPFSNPLQELPISEQPNPQSPRQPSSPVQEPSIYTNAGYSPPSLNQQPNQPLYPDQGPLIPSSVGPNLQQPNQLTYPEQGSSIPASISSNPQEFNQPLNSDQGVSNPTSAGPNSQQFNQLPSYPGQIPLLPANEQTNSQSLSPVQGPLVPVSSGTNTQLPSQPSYSIQGISNVGNTEPNSQQFRQSSQSSYPTQGSLNPSSVQPNNEQSNILSPGQVPSSPNNYPQSPGGPGVNNNRNQEGQGERTSKQYNGPEQGLNPSFTPGDTSVQGGQTGVVKPKLISVDMQIIDKNTDIHTLQPGERQGLPAGLSEHDMSRLLYTFNYTVGFHGHFEEGYANGVKKGYYYVTGRNGVRTRVDYVADKTGFHPKMSQELLDLLSDDVPKPDTEKDAKYGLKGYEFKWLYFPEDE